MCLAMRNEYMHKHRHVHTYRQTSHSLRTLVRNKIFYHSEVVGTETVVAAPTASSFST